MVNTFKLRLIVALVVAVAIMGSPPEAGAVLIGMTPGGPHSAITVNPDATTPAGYVNAWTLGSEQAPISVEYLATNGLWLAQLDGSPPLTIGQSIQLREYIKIGDGGPSWTDWSQRFVTEGFEFVSGTLSVDGNLIATGDLTSVGDNTIGFNFGALPAGTVIEIIKDIQWAGNASGESGNIFQGAPNLIQLEQFPTVADEELNPVVPEPATLGMIGMCLSLAGAFRAFRNRGFRKDKKTSSA